MDTRLMRFLALLVLGYLLLCALIYWRQSSLLYFPRPTPAKSLTGPAKLAFGERALVVDPDKPVTATAIVFHGNGGAAADRMYYAEKLAEYGVRVVLAEYPGYGWRDGTPSEKALVEDGLQLYQAVRAAIPADQPLLLFGESLGTGVAVQVAVKSQPQPDKLVLITPYDSIAALAQDRYWFLPVKWLLRDSYHSIAYLPQYQGEVTLLIAGSDEVIGPETGRRLAESVLAKDKLSVVEIGYAQHNTWLEAVRQDFWRDVVPGQSRKAAMRNAR